jgi:hypothetical protein
VYWQEGRQRVVSRDISSLFDNRQVTRNFFWSPDGRAAVDSTTDGTRQEQAVLDLEAMTSRKLPAHDDYLVVSEFAGGLIVRNGGWEKPLYIYRLSDGQEVVAAKGIRLGLRMGGCVSPDGRWVCWLEWAKPDGPAVVKTYDQQTGDIRAVHVDWPAQPGVYWSACGWSDDGRIAITGNQPLRPLTQPQSQPAEAQDPSTQSQPACTQATQTAKQPAFLRVLRVGFPQGPTESWSSPQVFAEWSVAPNAAYAFAWPPEGTLGGACCIDLRTHQQIPVDGNERFQWQRDSRAAYRVRSLGTGTWLYRFDVAQRREQATLRIPDGQDLLSLSPGGRFAILSDEVRHVYPLSLADVRTGQVCRLDVSLVSAMLASLGSDWQFFPWYSAWSSDERHFVLNRLDLPSQSAKLYLYDVPNGWAPGLTAGTTGAGAAALPGTN